MDEGIFIGCIKCLVRNIESSGYDVILKVMFLIVYEDVFVMDYLLFPKYTDWFIFILNR